MPSKAKFATMDAYIASFPMEVQGILEQIRQTIRKAAPGAVEAISYQIPTFKLNGGNLVHFAAWKEQRTSVRFRGKVILRRVRLF